MRSVGRWYAEGLRDVEESVPMRDKTRETLPLSRCILRRSVGRWYAEGLRDVEESVLMRDKTCETLPLFR